MTQQLTAYLHRLCVGFLLALFAWILARSGNIALLAVAAIAGALLLRHARTRELHDRIAAAAAPLPGRAVASVAVALALALRLWWAFHHDVVPVSDFARFYEDATAFAGGDTSVLGPAKSPTTVAFYGMLLRTFGATLPVVYAANAIVGALQVWLVYLITRRLAGATAAAFAAFALAVYPGVVSYYAWPNSEILFTSMFLLIVWQLLRLSDRPRGAGIATAILVGVEVAVMHLTRNSGIVVGAWLLVAALLWWRAAARTRLAFVAVTVAVCALCLTPQVVYNYRTFGYFSIQSSKWGALNLLSGTNMEFGGEHNRRDMGYLRQRHGTGDDTWKAASRDMRRIAIGRITDAPGRFLVFALTEKFDTMWCDDGYGATGLIHPDDRDSKATTVWGQRMNAFYAALIALAMVGVCAGTSAGAANRLFVVMAAGTLFVTFALHLFIEVQPRYHFIIAFVLPTLAAGLLMERSGGDESHSVVDVTE